MECWPRFFPLSASEATDSRETAAVTNLGFCYVMRGADRRTSESASKGKSSSSFTGFTR